MQHDLPCFHMFFFWVPPMLFDMSTWTSGKVWWADAGQWFFHFWSIWSCMFLVSVRELLLDFTGGWYPMEVCGGISNRRPAPGDVERSFCFLPPALKRRRAIGSDRGRDGARRKSSSRTQTDSAMVQTQQDRLGIPEKGGFQWHLLKFPEVQSLQYKNWIPQ